MNRRSFLTNGAVAAASFSVPFAPRQAVAEEGPPIQPFSDPDFGFSDLIALGLSYDRAGDPGKLLAILSEIKAGDFESGWLAFYKAGEEMRSLAESAGARRHVVSAREANLAAANYFSTALRFGDESENPDRMPVCFQQYAACWSAAAALFEPAIERIEIPYESVGLTGWFLRRDNSGHRKPLVILNNGADGLEISTYTLAEAALARGYHCLIFNGPGQADSLWVRKIYFRFDWEKVISPVVDAIVRRRDVDPKRMALIGMSQGGYMVPRALAFEHRIAAGVADPGVWDVSEPWVAHLPPVLRKALDDNEKNLFDRMMQMGTASNARNKAMLRFRMRPFGKESFFDAYQALKRYNLSETASLIRCPMLVTNPDGEQFFPGQAQKLYDALKCPKAIVHFTREQGADQHCEVAAPGYRAYCIFNWLDETLA